MKSADGYVAGAGSNYKTQVQLLSHQEYCEERRWLCGWSRKQLQDSGRVPISLGVCIVKSTDGYVAGAGSNYKTQVQFLSHWDYCEEYRWLCGWSTKQQQDSGRVPISLGVL